MLQISVALVIARRVGQEIAHTVIDIIQHAPRRV